MQHSGTVPPADPDDSMGAMIYEPCGHAWDGAENKPRKLRKPRQKTNGTRWNMLEHLGTSSWNSPDPHIIIK